MKSKFDEEFDIAIEEAMNSTEEDIIITPSPKWETLLNKEYNNDFDYDYYNDIVEIMDELNEYKGKVKVIIKYIPEWEEE